MLPKGHPLWVGGYMGKELAHSGSYIGYMDIWIWIYGYEEKISYCRMEEDDAPLWVGGYMGKELAHSGSYLFLYLFYLFILCYGRR